jgi:hypothetical protein
MEKVCAKCKKEFECKADDIENCDCNSIQMNSSMLEIIKEKFQDCLCVDCLKELNAKTTNVV